MCAWIGMFTSEKMFGTLVAKQIFWFPKKVDLYFVAPCCAFHHRSGAGFMPDSFLAETNINVAHVSTKTGSVSVIRCM
jgi:hypothetical protein